MRGIPQFFTQQTPVKHKIGNFTGAIRRALGAWMNNDNF
ncbi:hypothetical protein yrohd0001_33640 [Yersinia rohdei ATCC 43380]|nr:hypothetical protein yrohd0001_33640 [Yersinia rohdei ATCC 43380]